MIGLDVKIDKGEIKRAQKLLRAIPNGFERAASRALNKTAVRTRTVIVKAVRSDAPGLMVTVVRKAINIRRATFRFLSATIGLARRRIPLMKLAPTPKTPEADLQRKTRRGVSYRRPRGGRGRIAEAFVAEMPSGHTGVFKRIGEGRLPIVELRGPSVAEVFEASDTIAARVEAEAGRLLIVDLGTQVDLILRRAGR